MLKKLIILCIAFSSQLFATNYGDSKVGVFYGTTFDEKSASSFSAEYLKNAAPSVHFSLGFSYEKLGGYGNYRTTAAVLGIEIFSPDNNPAVFHMGAGLGGASYKSLFSSGFLGLLPLNIGLQIEIGRYHKLNFDAGALLVLNNDKMNSGVLGFAYDYWFTKEAAFHIGPSLTFINTGNYLGIHAGMIFTME
jgi:hypothetical protein